ncbi:MAG: hypothetical protein GY820_30975, partial [Gammaproteobacteria bacterium]|nr:hypothetical protein [Gammaproteobacteria bacterium]
MLNKLFKPAWQSGSVEQRCKAIAELHADNNEHQQILLQLASDDNEALIRLAALQRLTEHKAQYQGLVDNYPELQLPIATHAESPAIRLLAMQNLCSGQLLEILGETIYTDCRQFIAEKLEGIEDLESARKIMRGKDKNAERLIKARIDAFRLHHKQLAENKSRVEKLIEEIEYLAVHDWLPEFGVRCRSHRKQWDALEFEIEQEDRQRYQQAREVVDGHYERQRQIEETQQAQLQLNAELGVLLQTTAETDMVTLLEDLSAVQSKLHQYSVDWQASVEIHPPESPLLDQYEKLLGAMQSVMQFVDSAVAPLQDAREHDNKQAEAVPQLNAALKKLDWPVGFAPLKAATEVREQLNHWREAQQAAKAAHQQKLNRLHKNISSIFRFSRTGNLARAKQIAQKVQKALENFDGKEQAELQERFDEAGKTLGDMGDWKNFATEPKYIELCDAMELLTTSKQHAEKRSSEMKSLQQQW